MKTAIYPGSFNPFHEGHFDVLTKASKIFDKIVIAVGMDNGKFNRRECYLHINRWLRKFPKVKTVSFNGLLVDYIKKHKFDAVIRGLRNGADLQYEMNMQYTNEDLGLKIPIVYFITDRKYSHISSSMKREIERIKNGNN